jgi:hypothetical protein
MTTAPARQSITIYHDAQDPACVGWAYRVDGGESGPIYDAAADAIQRIIDCQEGANLAALRRAIGHRPGDSVEIAGPGMPGDLGDLLDR